MKDDEEKGRDGTRGDSAFRHFSFAVYPGRDEGTNKGAQGERRWGCLYKLEFAYGMVAAVAYL
jgi:hypothetical protein